MNSAEMEYYDSDMKNILWDIYDYQNLGDGLITCNKDDEWNSSFLNLRDCTSEKFNVVLRDRLMTDAALGNSNTDRPKPIKNEHSYSLLNCSSSDSLPDDGDNDSEEVPKCTENDSRQSKTHIDHDRVGTNDYSSQDAVNVFSSDNSRIDVINMDDEEYFQTISMDTTSSKDDLRETSECFTVTHNMNGLKPIQIVTNFSDSVMIKGEPLSAPSSPDSPCSVFDDKTAITMVSPHSIHLPEYIQQQSESEEEDDLDVDCREFKIEQVDLVIDNIPGIADVQDLPPTPPSSGCSDNESSGSASCSPKHIETHGTVIPVHQNVRGVQVHPKVYLANSTITTHTATRHPIHTPLISCQPKGSTGMLMLTEEEKRTLVAEGYEVPTKLPLTKFEEKCLKKVRRKIKNKISAQESRRKKKEYMDGLERRVILLTNENTAYREKVSNLENTNRSLLKELQRLQALVARK